MYVVGHFRCRTFSLLSASVDNVNVLMHVVIRCTCIKMLLKLELRFKQVISLSTSALEIMGGQRFNDTPLSRFNPPKSLTGGQLGRSSFNEIRFMSSLFLHSFIVQTQGVTTIPAEIFNDDTCIMYVSTIEILCLY